MNLALSRSHFLVGSSASTSAFTLASLANPLVAGAKQNVRNLPCADA